MATTTNQQSALEARIIDMDQGHLRCRDIGHIWRDHTPSEIHDDDGYDGWRRVLRCDTRRGGCGTERSEIIDMDGSIRRRNYSYPQGYQLKGLGMRGIPKSNFRREYLTRVLKIRSS